MKKKISIFGSTGSVGRSSLDVYEAHKDKFSLIGLTINNNYKQLILQIKKYSPKVVAIKDNEAFNLFNKEYNDPNLIVLGGDNCLIDILDFEVDFIMAGIVGSAGLLPVIEAARKLHACMVYPRLSQHDHVFVLAILVKDQSNQRSDLHQLLTTFDWFCGVKLFEHIDSDIKNFTA